MNVSLKVSGVRDVQLALQNYANAIGGNASAGIRQAGSFVAASLAKRTRKPHGRGAYPKFVEAAEADAVALEPHIENKAGISAGQFRGYLKHVAGNAYVAIADHPMKHGLPYRILALFDKDKYSLADLRAAYCYRKAGLAKQAWKWAAKAARRKTSSTGVRGLAAVEQARLGLTLVDRIAYARQALDGAGAVEEALHAAANRMRGYIRNRLEKAAKKAGLAS